MHAVRGALKELEPDPRQGVAAGHIPARNLPFALLYNDDGTFKSPDEIRTV